MLKKSSPIFPVAPRLSPITSVQELAFLWVQNSDDRHRTARAWRGIARYHPNGMDRLQNSSRGRDLSSSSELPRRVHDAHGTFMSQDLHLAERICSNSSGLRDDASSADISSADAKATNKAHMTRDKPARIRCRTIREADIHAVTEMLVEGIPGRTAANWAHAMQQLARREVPATYPRFGYLLEVDDMPVGVILLIFSTQFGERGSHVRCNTSALYVKESYRGYASFLTKAAVNRADVTYVNISPSPHTWAIIEAQGFTRYTFGQTVAFPALSASVANSSVLEFQAAADYGPTLSEEERRVLTSHRDYGCLAYVVMENGNANPFIFRPRRINRGIVPALQLVYCRDVCDFARLAGPIGRTLARRGMFVVCLDAVGPLPGLVGKYFADRGHRRYFKGSERPRIGDLTDSELVLFR